MSEVEGHYSAGGLTERIANALKTAGKSLDRLATDDLAPVDEFHIRGRKATLELAAGLNLGPQSRVLDLGAGLGGPARTLAEVWGCHVTGIDLTAEFCDAAAELSRWTGLADRTDFVQGDATDLPFDDAAFDSVLTFHVAMNIAAKDRLYAEARRVLRPGGRFLVYDVMQGEGGDILYPVPWARDASISHMATPAATATLLAAAGFTVLETVDSTDESLSWFLDRLEQAKRSGAPPVSIGLIFSEGYLEMVKNQVRNLAERRIRTVSFLCEV